VYASRGVGSLQELNYRLTALHSPEKMLGISAAATLLADAIAAGQHILIVGDFDADGATSTALSMLLLRAMGASVGYLVPNRFDFGHGLTPEIVAVAAERHPDVIVTVDNGISSVEGVAAAHKLGIKVVVTDHHLPGKVIPAAEVIVNPNQVGCQFPSKNLAGVGVIFYVMSALRRELRNRKWFESRGISEPVMADVLDLVALGTVADVVPLDANNRRLISQGLARIRAGRARPGIRALLELAKRDPGSTCAADLAFAVGPRLNAAGRLDDMSTGIECLLAEHNSDALQLAGALEDMNVQRRAIEADMQRTAASALESLVLADDSVSATGICLFDASWHQGVIGILASRIKERFHRPVIAFADAGDGMIKGSARSIPGLHIRDALDAIAAGNPGLLEKFGGHAMAAGMTLRKDDFREFSQAFDAEAARWLDEDQLQSVLLTDGELGVSDFTLDFARAVTEAGPWGQHFPEPVFEGRFKLVQQRLVGERHLKLVLSTSENEDLLLDAIAFNVDLEVWPNQTASGLFACFRIGVNRFRGQTTMQLTIEYLEPLGA
jgi:single-stranded-DNA-specific exonuclease